MTRGNTPVASGSSVPKCPTERCPKMRRTRLTTSCEVRPAGLSMTRTPFIAVLCYRGRGWPPSQLSRNSCNSNGVKTMLPIRDDQPRFSTPYVTYFLIAINLIFFFVESALGPDNFRLFIYQFGMIPAHVTAVVTGAGDIAPVGAFIPLFTSMFLHGS